METDIDILSKIAICKKKSTFLSSVDLKKLPTGTGIVLFFVEDLRTVKFKESEVGQTGFDSIVLMQSIENFDQTNIYFKPTKNIRSEVRKFKKNNIKQRSIPQVIFSQISDTQTIKVGYFELESKYYNAQILMNRYLETHDEKPVMNKSFKQNDATPSWNGFNFQGFVTVLRTLQMMNSMPETDYERYSVEIERIEDFVIYKDGEAKELFQVKAYVSERTVESYIEALKKLLLHKEILRATDAKCFLATASRIKDWDQSGYQDTIELYGYDNNIFLDINAIISNIKNELSIFFNNIEGEQGHSEINIALARICHMVIKKINYLHQNRIADNEEYKINFKYIDDAIRKSAEELIEDKEFFTRVQVDKTVLENFNRELAFVCEDCIDMGCELCPLNNLRDIFESINRKKYAKVFSPGTPSDKLDIYLSSVFNQNNVQNLLEELACSASDILFYDDQKIYIANVTDYEEYLEKIVPSAISIKRNGGLTRVLDIIKDDVDIQQVYANSSILANIKDEKIVYKDQKVYSIPDGFIDETIYDENDSISPDFNFNLVNRDLFLERNGDNE